MSWTMSDLCEIHDFEMIYLWYPLIHYDLASWQSDISGMTHPRWWTWGKSWEWSAPLGPPWSRAPMTEAAILEDILCHLHPSQFDCTSCPGTFCQELFMSRLVEAFDFIGFMTLQFSSSFHMQDLCLWDFGSAADFSEFSRQAHPGIWSVDVRPVLHSLGHLKRCEDMWRHMTQAWTCFRLHHHARLPCASFPLKGENYGWVASKKKIEKNTSVSHGLQISLGSPIDMKILRVEIKPLDDKTWNWLFQLFLMISVSRQRGT